VKVLFQTIYTDFAYFEREKIHLKILCSEIADVMIFYPRCLPLLLSEISNGKKTISWKLCMKFRNKIGNQVSDYRTLRGVLISTVTVCAKNH